MIIKDVKKIDEDTYEYIMKIDRRANRTNKYKSIADELVKWRCKYIYMFFELNKKTQNELTVAKKVLTNCEDKDFSYMFLKSEKITKELKNNPDIAVVILSKCSELIKEYDKEIFNDKTILNRLSKRDVSFIDYLDLEEKEKIKYIKTFIKNNPDQTKKIPKEYLNNKDIINYGLKEIKLSRIKTQMTIGKELQKDNEYMKEIIKEYPRQYMFVNKELAKDKELLLSVITRQEKHNQFGEFIKYASDELKDDKEIALIAVKNSLYHEAFKYISERLKDDKEVALEAVLYGSNIKFVSDRLKDDKEVVLTAIKNNWSADSIYNYVSERLKNDRDIVIEAVKNKDDNIENIIEKFKTDREIAIVAINNYAGNFQYISKELQHDKEIALLAIKNSKDDRIREFIFDLIGDDESIIDYIEQNL